MKRLVLPFLALVAAASVAVAADNDPIATRQALMDGNAVSAGVSMAMIKGQLAYDAKMAKAAIQQLHSTAHTFGTLFPEGSQKGQTEAAASIWSDRAGFEKALLAFQADADKALEAAGGKGPADLDSFKAVIMPVLKNCRSCHENYKD